MKSHQTPALESLLAEFEDRERAEQVGINSLSPEEFLARRDEFLLPVGRPAGQFLASLIVSMRPRHILELGTGFGYSTLWLASAAAEVGATLTTVDQVTAKSDYAKAKASAAGLNDTVRFVTADALEFVPRLGSRVDMVFIDVWKDDYLKCFDVCVPTVAEHAVVVADNMLHPARHRPLAQTYRAHIRRAWGVESVVLPIGNGLDLAVVSPHKHAAG